MHLQWKYKFWFLATNGLSVAGFWCTDVAVAKKQQYAASARACSKTPSHYHETKNCNLFVAVSFARRAAVVHLNHVFL